MGEGMADTAPKKPVTLTRKELYDRVWASPMTKLAAEFGISDVGLIKICKRLDVPRPPQGHWAKKAAGKKVGHVPLREPKDGTPQSATISPTPPPDPAAVLPKEVEAKVEAARKEVAKVPVPDKLLRPHPIVAGWIAERDESRRKAREERRRWGTGYDPGEFTAVEKREHRILDALFKAVERHGGKVHEGTPRGRIVEMGKEKIEFQIRQKQRQVRRPPMAEESRQSWHKGKEFIIETKTTDFLVFKVRTYLPAGLRSEWLETEERPLEGMLPDIVATFVAAGPLLLQQRLEREEEHRRWEAEQEKRREQERRRKQDDNRWRLFSRFADQANEIELARRFLAGLKAKEADLGETVGEQSVGEWIKWAEKRIEMGDPLRHEARDIFNTLSKVTEWTRIDDD
jgi:hypothetical protein